MVIVMIVPNIMIETGWRSRNRVKMRTKIGTIAIKIMKEQDRKYVSVGEFGLLHDIFDEAIKQNATKPLKRNHPLNVFQRILNALDRDERFDKEHIYFAGIHKNAVRSFKIKKDVLE